MESEALNNQIKLAFEILGAPQISDKALPTEKANESKTENPALASQVSQREIVFKNAVSKAELAILRALVEITTGSGVEISNHQRGSVLQNSQAKSFHEASNNLSNDSQLLQILNSDPLKISDPQASLAIKIIRLLSASLLPQEQPKDSHATKELLTVLKNLDSIELDSSKASSELVKAIKNQNTLSPEQRSTLIQSLVSTSQSDNLLLENFLNRRNEVVDAKREILSILQLLNTSNPASELKIVGSASIENLASLIPTYLSLLLTDSSSKLNSFEKLIPDEKLRLILSALKYDTTPGFSSTIEKSEKHPELSVALLIDDIIKKIASYVDLGDESQNFKPNETQESFFQTKQVLKSLLLKQSLNSATESSINEQNQKLLLENGVKPSDKVDSASILKELITKLPGFADTEESQDITRLSAKVFVNSPLLNDLKSKVQSVLISSATGNESTTPELGSKLDLYLSTLQAAVQANSPELFRAGSQFLRAIVGNQDILSAVTSLLIPIFGLISISGTDDNPKIKSELATVSEQLENLKTLANKSGNKQKEALSLVLEKGSKLLDLFEESRSQSAKSEYEMKLFDSLGKDTVSRLNALAEKIAQPNFFSVDLYAAQRHAKLEIGLQPRTAQNLDEEKQDGASSNQTSSTEKLECSILLPNLGECGLSVTILGNQVSINICNSQQLVVSTAVPLIPQLEQRLRELDFENPTIEVSCKKPKPAKPEWILELLGINSA